MQREEYDAPIFSARMNSMTKEPRLVTEDRKATVVTSVP